MFKSMRESRFVMDSFVEGDSEAEDVRPPEDEAEDDGSHGVKKVAKKDSKKVKVWRYLVILMLLLAGGSTSALTYMLLNGEEEDNFETSVSFASAPLLYYPTRLASVFVLTRSLVAPRSTKFSPKLSKMFPKIISIASTRPLTAWQRLLPGQLSQLEQPSHSFPSQCSKFKANMLAKSRVLKY